MFELEHTDTFSGEANYCWVRRKTIPDNPSRRSLVRQAKAFAGFTGLRCNVVDYGDSMQITPTGRDALCQTVFVTWVDA
jgi:hypothetical protein